MYAIREAHAEFDARAAEKTIQDLRDVVIRTDGIAAWRGATGRQPDLPTPLDFKCPVCREVVMARGNAPNDVGPLFLIVAGTAEFADFVDEIVGQLEYAVTRFRHLRGFRS